jgi:hypothetical protein
MKWTVAAMCIFFTVRASGQATAQPPFPVVIEGWHYDPKGAVGKTITLHLVNRSNKDATAWNISIAEKYADGSTDYVDGRPNRLGDHQVMEDMLGALIQRQLMGAVQKALTIPERNRTFAAGTSRDYMIPEAKDIADIEAVVDVVAYADGTADVQNDRAFKNLVAARKGPVLAMQKVVEVIKGVLADPMVSSPIAEVLRALRPLADADLGKNRPPEDPEFFEAMHLQNKLKDLQTEPTFWSRLTKMNEREWLTRYVEQQEKQIALLSPHANLVPTLYGQKAANQ